MPPTQRKDMKNPDSVVRDARRPGISSSLLWFTRDSLGQYHARIMKFRRLRPQGHPVQRPGYGRKAIKIALAMRIDGIRRSPDENRNDLSLRTLLHRAAKLQPGSS